MAQAQQKPQTAPTEAFPAEVEHLGPSRFSLARPAAFSRNAVQESLQQQSLAPEGRLLSEIAEFLYRTTPEMLRSAPVPATPPRPEPVQPSKPEAGQPALDQALDEVVLTSLWRSLEPRDRTTVTNMMKVMLLGRKAV